MFGFLFSSLYPNRRWLQQQKLTFIEGCERIENTPQCFLQHCILPRALFSPEDAYFCAMFTAILNELQVRHFVAWFCCCCLLSVCCPVTHSCCHKLRALFYCFFIKTPRWSSLNYYDKLHRCLASVVYCVTEREAANLGIFLQETLRLLERWNNPRIYTNECANKPGFSISIRQASGQRATFDQYVKIFGKWHSKVSR